MRRRNANRALLALALLALPAFPLSRGGMPRGDGVEQEPAIRPLYLPLSAKAARAWATLHGTPIRPLPCGTPLREVIRAITEAGRGEGGRPMLRFYINPAALQEQEITLETPVVAPPDHERERPLRVYLREVLRPLGLNHRVHDDLVIMNSFGCGDGMPPPPEITASMARAWAFLHEEVPERFEGGARLDQVIAEIQKSVEARKLPWGGGLVVEYDGLVVTGGGEGRECPLAIDMAGVPLCTALGQSLSWSRGFIVRPDGVVEIIDKSTARGDSYADESDAIEGYRAVHYYAMERAKAMRRAREGRPANP